VGAGALEAEVAGLPRGPDAGPHGAGHTPMVPRHAVSPPPGEEGEEAGVLAWDAAAGVVTCSGAARRLLGHAGVDHSRPLASLLRRVVRADRRRAIATLRRIDAGADAFFEHVQFRADGATRHVEVAGIVERDGIGAAARVRVVARDVSARHAADARLRADGQRFRLAFEASPDATCIIDLEQQRFVHVSAGFERLSGFTAAALRQRPAGDRDLWVNPGRRRALHARLQRGAVLDFTARFRRADGSEFLGSLSANAIEQDGHRYLVASVRDISRTRAAERALRASEEHFARLFHSAPIGICVVALGDETLRDANAALAEMLSTSIASLRGRRAGDVLHWPDFTAIAERLRDRGEVRDQATHFAVPGRPFHALVSARSVDFGGISCGLFHVTDIEEHRRLELQLRHAFRMQAIGELAGGVAHDFNNLLGGISGFAELLLHEQGLPGPAREQAERILDTVRRAAELTRQLLNFSRREPLRTDVVDVHDLVHATVAILEQSVDRRVRIERDLAGVPACVDGDAAQIGNALLNLCLNARDAMPDGGVLTISTDIVAIDAPWAGRPELEVGPGRYLRLSVADTGTGIAADAVDRIFDPFFTTKAPGQGTGLGLAAVWGMLRAHGGTVDVATAPGRGTVFSLFLPAATRAAAPAAPANTLQRPQQGSGRILVCDDEPMLRELLRAMLGSLGYDVQLASDGADAVACLRAAPPGSIDLVLLDVTMPQMNGRDAHRALRRIDPGVPVLLMSGHAGHGEIDAALEDGAAGVIAKPFDLATLSRRVLDALATREHAATATARDRGD
jgi:PAS domain S-box-containing protein